MDFGTLLQTAKENEQNKREVRYYSTKFSPPKKEEKKAKALSANIQKFLARKEAEEKQKMKEANRKRDELLALRSKDKKATRRVNVMLKRTKSANQSVIEDAVDKDNTAVTLAGPSQPDEDDYGYVSQEAAAFYNKMMEKYSKMPEEPKFPSSKKRASSNLSSTKDRVKAALEREKEEALLPHKRKRKHHDQEADPSREDNSEQEERYEPTPAKNKPKLSAPPVMNFTDLLKLAEQKQFQPIMVEVKPKEEEGPLMTKKQKKEFERVQQWKESKKNRELGKPNPEKTENRIPKVSSAQTNGHKIKPSGDNSQLPSKPSIPIKSANIDKLSNNLPKSLPSAQNVKSRDKEVVHRNSSQVQKGSLKSEISSSKLDSSKQKPPPSLPSSMPKKKPENNMIPNKKPQPIKEVERKSVSSKPLGNSYSQSSTSKPITKSNGNITNHKKDITINNGSRELQRSKVPNMKEKEMPSKNIQPTKKAPLNDFKPKQLPQKDLKPKQLPPPNLKPKQLPPPDLKPKQFSPPDLKPKQFPPPDLKPKQFPPADLKPKQFPPPDVRRKEFPPKDVKRKPAVANKRRIIDDDDEYDSEMDDFIDDGPEETEDYSKYIKDIFGYDKSRYRGVDEDDIDNMESSFAQQMREDIRSTKLGIMEDLEDIKREKEEKRVKALMKKRR
ncbi:hypothetical protein ILUMI_04454 [Ignelater luminosus]|uniref:Protein SPT2 homolog n=1 Tax=Ignelater luminosus TaxID=2038154 RepID=A0A8K0GJK2_IGNLU|nr:hypothetical protein ILUMI_04454 [Ignelater luminosus]